MSEPSFVRSDACSPAAVGATTAGVIIVGGDDFLELDQGLRRHGYRVVTARTASAAIRELKRIAIDAVLCNHALPDSDGLDVISRVHAINSDVSVIMFSRQVHPRDVRCALLSGACDYLLEPFTLGEVASTVERAIRGRVLGAPPARSRPRSIDREARAGARRLSPYKRLEFVSMEIAETLINAMEAKNAYLRGHSQRVAELAASVAEEMSLSAEHVEQIRLAGRLHDIGKIGIREAVLDKPGQLQPDEYAHVQDHVNIGLQILAPLMHLGVVFDYIAEHHERLDGSGYPRGLSGDAISLGGRIIATADVFDALTSRRAYRDPRSEQDTLTYMEGLVGKSLFREPFDALRRVVDQRQSLVFLGDMRVPGAHIADSTELAAIPARTEGLAREAVATPPTPARQVAQPRALAGAIHHLPQLERTILALWYVEGLTDLEIAQVFNLDVGCVVEHRSAALIKLSSSAGL
jgi:putative nucleotidyltransferase with HDIG domain